jgi:CNT family concentrative nucleoside transporter
MDRLAPLLGLVALLAAAWGLSTDKRRVRPRIVVTGLLLQFAIAGLLIRVPEVVRVYDALAGAVSKLLSFAAEGGRFIFGNLGETNPQGWGFVFAASVLPIIIFFASLMAVLYHLGVMQRVIAGLAWLLRRTLGVSGEEALAAAANIFVGQTEAPLCIRPAIPGLTRSQLMLVMTCGFATIAGSVLAAVVAMLGRGDPQAQIEFTKHLLTASAMSAPGAFVIAKIMIPDEAAAAQPPAGPLRAMHDRETVNLLDAAAAGAADGLKLALNVAAMLVAFVAIIAMLNWPLQALGGTGPGRWLTGVLGVESLSLSSILGAMFAPVAWLMGLRGPDVPAVGSVLGTGMVATEFVAYLRLGGLIESGGVSPRAAAVASYALCGFANFPSIAIQIGGLSAMAPERRAEIAALGPRAMLAGAMTCWMTGCIAAVFLPA